VSSSSRIPRPFILLVSTDSLSVWPNPSTIKKKKGGEWVLLPEASRRGLEGVKVAEGDRLIRIEKKSLEVRDKIQLVHLS
jgi:hypothetical protein